MSILFGTDGIRGVANLDLTPEQALKLGRACAGVVSADLKHNRPPLILIGRDTRLSGPMIESALTAGLLSLGADVIRLGVVPTPTVAYLTSALGADAGMMISAAHNPVADNGIKFFNRDGYKLPEEAEKEIERLTLSEPDGLPRPTGTNVGYIHDDEKWRKVYTDFLRHAVGDLDLSGVRLVLDCAHGTACDLAPAVFRSLGAEVTVLHGMADGARINAACGSTNPEKLCAAVQEYGAFMGLAFDGDADRVVAADELGQVVDGDRIMAVCALERLAAGNLPGNAIAATVYSNLGLQDALRAAGGDVVFTPTGDRSVLQAMLRDGLVLGGEQSGHIIFLEHQTTADGLLSGLMLVGTVIRSVRPLSELAACMKAYPQVRRDVKVARKNELESNQAVLAAVADATRQLAERGRILLRPSGTEDLVRIMVEGPDEKELSKIVAELAATIKRELGE